MVVAEEVVEVMAEEVVEVVEVVLDCQQNMLWAGVVIVEGVVGVRREVVVVEDMVVGLEVDTGMALEYLQNKL